MFSALDIVKNSNPGIDLTGANSPVAPTPLSSGAPMPALDSGMQYLKPQSQFPSFAAPVGNANSTIPQAPHYNIPASGPVNAPEQFKPMIESSAKKYGVPANVVAAVIAKESGFNPNAKNVSKKEASFGLGQINTRAHAVTPQQAQDPAFAIDFVAKRLSTMVNKYGLYEGIQAYNTPGAIGSQELIDYANKIFQLAGLVPTAYAKGPAGLNNLDPTKKKRVKKGAGGPGMFQNLPKTLSGLGNKTVDYGDKTKYEGSHPGLDFANAKGTPIPSAVPGTVTGVDAGHQHGDQGFGNRVEITDGQGNRHLYSHLDKIHAQVGQPVGPGQPIATMGDSGSTYSPGGGDSTHLDYRIVNAYNRYVSPYKYFSQKK